MVGTKQGASPCGYPLPIGLIAKFVVIKVIDTPTHGGLDGPMAVEAPAVADSQAASPSGMLAVMILIAILIVVRLVPVGDTGMCPEEPTLATA